MGAAAAGAYGQGFYEQFGGFPPSGWAMRNQSQFASEGDGWVGVQFFPPFPAHSEPSFAASGATANTSTGVISCWLFTPVRQYRNGDTLSFWARSLNEHPDGCNCG
jgi:hypothetical protein